MDILIYALSAISIFLAIGGFSAYAQTKQPGLLISSLVSIAFSGLAIYLAEWWPLVASFVINWILRLVGLDPDYKK